MVTTIRARFDGEVFRPQEPLDLQVDGIYTLTIEANEVVTADKDDDDYPLAVIERMAVDLGVDDLAEHHTWYAHGRRSGLPKNG